jgi:hypothetical protein
MDKTPAPGLFETGFAVFLRSGVPPPRPPPRIRQRLIRLGEAEPAARQVAIALNHIIAPAVE